MGAAGCDCVPPPPPTPSAPPPPAPDPKPPDPQYPPPLTWPPKQSWDRSFPLVPSPAPESLDAAILPEAIAAPTPLADLLRSESLVVTPARAAYVTGQLDVSSLMPVIVLACGAFVLVLRRVAVVREDLGEGREQWRFSDRRIPHLFLASRLTTIDLL